MLTIEDEWLNEVILGKNKEKQCQIIFDLNLK